MMLDDFLQEAGNATLKDLEKVSENPVPPLVTPQHLLTSGPKTNGAFKTHGVGGRVEWYLGPDQEIAFEALDQYEKQGGWIIEPKWDGMWAMLTVGNPEASKPHTLKSRAADTGYVGGGNSGDLMTVPLPLQPGAILVGELEATSEWSTKQVEKQGGVRRLHLFDIPFGLSDYRDLTLIDRRKLLDLTAASFSPLAAARFPVVERHEDKFAARYEGWLLSGLEGCVLKRATSRYRTVRADGKTDLWLRCKKRVTEDYVLMALGKTKGGAPTGVWGLFKAGKMTRVFQGPAPKAVLQEKCVGKVVCEFMGWARHDSGSLRHAQFVRVRPDKTPEMCVWEKK